MKKLVVYYSLEGNTRLMAESIASEVDATILEIKPKKDVSPKGFMKYIWGGKAAMMKESPELYPIEINPEDYDLIFFGTPVWAWTFAPPFNTFFNQYQFKDKKVALFCCHGGGKGSIFDKLKTAIGNQNQFLGEIDFRDPLTHSPEEAKQKIKEWAKKLIPAEE